MKKTLTMVLALVLVFALGVGGTLAWLSATTAPVVNTFTVGDINIDLNEHDYDPATKALTNEVVKTNDDYKFVPGDTLPKDPYVTVKAGSEACWLFIKIDETNNNVTGLNGKVVSYGIDTGVWSAVQGETNVWYKQLDATTADTNYNVLKDTQVTVNSNVTKAMVEGINENQPELTFTAYAIQSANLKNGETAVTTAEAAWALVKPAQ